MTLDTTEYLGLTPDGKLRDWPDLTIPAPDFNNLPPPDELGVCYYLCKDNESISYGLKIIFDIVDPKKDGKIYRISRTAENKREETRFNTRQHIVNASNKYVLIAVGYNGITKPTVPSDT